jgi:hypothetical protein
MPPSYEKQPSQHIPSKVPPLVFKQVLRGINHLLGTSHASADSVFQIVANARQLGEHVKAGRAKTGSTVFVDIVLGTVSIKEKNTAKIGVSSTAILP